ncbi:hypothetical protein [Streptomyces wuyuanensis]|uniref:hypothetical protein n=1 Tax=Streptomyces wuyuanensis TaxID=1196353 RepID=UPI0014300E90|nr:hypothetical protein [Streptomyces wuyuanensis]
MASLIFSSWTSILTSPPTALSAPVTSPTMRAWFVTAVSLAKSRSISSCDM